jgi:nucleoside triphosphate pyrophosphatase
VSLAPGEPLVLASGSATRARLLADAGLPILVDPAAVDEEEIRASFRAEGRDAAACAAALAEAKAVRVSARHPGALVLGADQILDCDGRWLEKPRDLDAARDQLTRLRGKRHTLITAAAVARNGAVVWHTSDRAHLTMRGFSDRFLDDYVAAAGNELMDSVGAYRLEGLGAQLFARVDGDFFTILGLPLLPLLDFLRDHGALET